MLKEARDAVQTIHISTTTIVAGSVDGHVRTYDLRKGELRSDFIGRVSFRFACFVFLFTQLYAEPVTSVVPTQDNQTLLVTTLDSHIRLMDMTSGKMLNDFTGHKNDSYRCRACFGHAEATIISGDEMGRVWAWDLLDVYVSEQSQHCYKSDVCAARPRLYPRTPLRRHTTRSSHGQSIIQLRQGK